MFFRSIHDVIAEGARLTEEQFFRAHSEPAFIVEPNDPERRRGTPFHPQARVAWASLAACEDAIAILCGRSRSCQIHLPHPSISTVHAMFRWVFQTGTWFVEDGGSATGSCLNGHALVPGEPTPVVNGDVLALGGLVTVRPFFAQRALRETLLRPDVDLDRVARDLQMHGIEVKVRGNELRLASDPAELHAFFVKRVCVVELLVDGAIWMRRTIFLGRDRERAVCEAVKEIAHFFLSPRSGRAHRTERIDGMVAFAGRDLSAA